MAQRVIPCRVLDDYITGDGVTIGGAGSHDEVLLELDFRAADAVWAGTTRTVTFTNALGLDPVNVLLTTNLLSEGQTEVYRVPVPVRCKAYPGWISVTVSGVEVSGDQEVLRIATGDARFRVLDNVLHRWEGSGDVPASATEQLQAEIDAIKEFVQIPTEERLSDYFAAHPEIKVTNGAVTTPKIADGAVTEDKLGEDVKSVHTALSNRIQTVERNQTSPYNFKGAVADLAELEVVENPSQNDTYFVEDLQCRYTWTGSDWQRSSLNESEYEDELSYVTNQLEGTVIPSAFFTRSYGYRLFSSGSIGAAADCYAASSTYFHASAGLRIIAADGYQVAVAEYSSESYSARTRFSDYAGMQIIVGTGFFRFGVKKTDETTITKENFDGAFRLQYGTAENNLSWQDLLTEAEIRMGVYYTADFELKTSRRMGTSSLLPVAGARVLLIQGVYVNPSGASESTNRIIAFDADKEPVSVIGIFAANAEQDEEREIRRFILLNDESVKYVLFSFAFGQFSEIHVYAQGGEMYFAAAAAMRNRERIETLETQKFAIKRNSAASVAEIIRVAESYKGQKNAGGEYVMHYGNRTPLQNNYQNDNSIDCSTFLGFVLRGIPYAESPYGMTDDEPDYESDDGSGTDDQDGPDGNYDYTQWTANPAYPWSCNPGQYTLTLDYDIMGYPTTTDPMYLVARRASQIAELYCRLGREIPMDDTLSNLEPGDLVFWAFKNADGTWHNPHRWRHITHIAMIVDKVRATNDDPWDTDKHPWKHTCIEVRNPGSGNDVVCYRTLEAEGPETGTNVNTMVCVCRPDLGSMTAPLERMDVETLEGGPEGYLRFDDDYLYLRTANGWKRIPLEVLP